MGAGVINGVSALLVPLPLRYAAVVPAQNASGCPTPRHTGTSILAISERNKANMSAYVTDRNAIHGQRPRIPARRAIWPVRNAPGRAEHWAQGLVSQPPRRHTWLRDRCTGMNIMKYTETKTGFEGGNRERKERALLASVATIDWHCQSIGH